MGQELQVLPDDCWELIFRKLQGTDLKSISLVSKHFLSISNGCHYEITIYSSQRTIIPRLLRRFRNINKIVIWGLDPHSTINETMFELASSGLNLQTLVFNLRCKWYPIPKEGWKELGFVMKNLKYLHCPNFYYLDDDILSAIVTSMTSLKVLKMGTDYDPCMPLHRVSDRGIEILAASLPHLEEIDISGFTFLSDHSFDALSSKCKFLRVVKADGVPRISHLGIGYVLGRNRHLEYLSCLALSWSPVYYEVFSSLDCKITYEEASGSMNFTKGNLLDDELIRSIVKAKIPLKKLLISHCRNVNVSGLIAFLTGHPSLTCLEIESIDLDFISDKVIADLCPYLSNMKSICLIGGRLNLGRSSFLNLAESCHSLEEFRVEHLMGRPVFTWVSSDPYSLDDDSVNGAEQKIRQAYYRLASRYYYIL